MKLLVLAKLIAAEKKGLLCCVSNSSLTDKVKIAYEAFARGQQNLDIPLTTAQFYELTKILMHHKKKNGKLDGLYASLVSEMNLAGLIAKDLDQLIDKLNPTTLKHSLENHIFYECMRLIIAANITLGMNHAFFNLHDGAYEYVHGFYLEFLEAKPYSKELFARVLTLIDASPATPVLHTMPLAIHPQFDFNAFTNQPCKKIAVELILGMDPSYPGKNIGLIINCPNLAKLEHLGSILFEPGNQVEIEAIISSPRSEILNRAYLIMMHHPKKHELFQQILNCLEPIQLAEILIRSDIPCHPRVLTSKHPAALQRGLERLTRFGILKYNDQLLDKIDGAEDPEAEAQNFIKNTRAALSQFAALAAPKPKEPILDADLGRESPVPLI